MDPDLRLTVADGVLHATDRTPWLAGRGPSRQLLRDAAEHHGALTYADVEVVRHEEVATELVVRVLAGRPEALRGPLLRWAQLVGFERVWLPGELVRCEPAPGGEVGVTCGLCGGRFEEDDADFWDVVRRNGHFPLRCPWCGASLPQWTRVRDAAAATTLGVEVGSNEAAGGAARGGRMMGRARAGGAT